MLGNPGICLSPQACLLRQLGRCQWVYRRPLRYGHSHFHSRWVYRRPLLYGHSHSHSLRPSQLEFLLTGLWHVLRATPTPTSTSSGFTGARSGYGHSHSHSHFQWVYLRPLLYGHSHSHSLRPSQLEFFAYRTLHVFEPPPLPPPWPACTDIGNAKAMAIISTNNNRMVVPPRSQLSSA